MRSEKQKTAPFSLDCIQLLNDLKANVEENKRKQALIKDFKVSEKDTGSGERDILLYTFMAATWRIALTIIEIIDVRSEVEKALFIA